MYRNICLYMNKRLLFQSKERYFIFMFLFPLAAYMDV